MTHKKVDWFNVLTVVFYVLYVVALAAVAYNLYFGYGKTGI